MYGGRMRVVKGNLLELAYKGEFDVIVHGCNCFHMMGAGIARQIALAFPEAHRADRASAYGDPEKLGTLSVGHCQGPGGDFDVVNAYTQFQGGANLEYHALRDAFRAVRAQYAGKRIGYPRIGAGIGGGDWDRIARIIEVELAGENHTLVEFTG